jgi:N-carbamoyl-L-amino-acid hydrolase
LGGPTDPRRRSIVSAAPTAFDPARVVANLKELRALTGGPEGARRLAWTDEWIVARDFLRAKLAEIPGVGGAEMDEAGNLWASLPGARPEAVVVGSHVDAVPQGGWLDGVLGVMAGLEVLRAAAAAGTPPCTVTLVDWADEEGARFGRSLLGSSAFAGTLELDEVKRLLTAAIQYQEGVAAASVAIALFAGLRDFSTSTWTISEGAVLICPS